MLRNCACSLSYITRIFLSTTLATLMLIYSYPSYSDLSLIDDPVPGQTCLTFDIQRSTFIILKLYYSSSDFFPTWPNCLRRNAPPTYVSSYIYHKSSISTCTKKKVLVNDSAIADVSFRSADGKIFHVQRKYLEVNTGSFPSAEFNTQGELVHLTESSAVLEALFRFAYPIIQPNLEDVGFEVIAAVAEAAEKYQVFSAMNFCRLRLRLVTNSV